MRTDLPGLLLFFPIHEYLNIHPVQGMAQGAVTPSSLVVCTGSRGNRHLCCVWVAVCSLLSVRMLLSLMCVMLRSVSDLALEVLSGLSSTYWLLGHTSRIKPGQGVVLWALGSGVSLERGGCVVSILACGGRSRHSSVFLRPFYSSV